MLRSFLGARENARRFGLEFRSDFDERLARACEFSMHVHRPDGSIPALSDSDSGSYLDLLALGADLLRSADQSRPEGGVRLQPDQGRPDWLYVATRGQRGTPPTYTSANFPIGGYFVQRSGWGDGGGSFEGERFLAFDCGPLGDGGHGHYDALSIEVASGRPLVVDPGRYTYCDDSPHWRRWFKSTAAHNTVTVDGLDQTPYCRGKPRAGMARASLTQRLTARGLDVLYGEVTSPAVRGHPPAAHPFRRRRGPARPRQPRGIAAASGHVLRFHLAPDAAGAPGVTRAGARGTRAPGLGLLVAPPWPISIEEGWVSAAYGVKEPAPVVVATADGVGRADFFSLLMPLGDAAPMPAFEVTRQAVDGDEVIVADISSATPSEMRRDRVMWTVSGHAAALPGAGMAAAAAVLDAGATHRTQVFIPEPVDVYADCGDGRMPVPGVAV